MKTLSLIVDLIDIDLPSTVKDFSVQEITSRVIYNIINISAQQSRNRGLSFEDQRKFYKLGDVLDIAVKEKRDSVELEDAWFDLIKKAMKEAQMAPDKLLNRVYDLIEAVK